MQLFKHIDRINLIDKLTRQRRTGTPSELARRLGISTIRLHQIIESLRLIDVPICYSRHHQTYYYEKDYEVNIQINIRELDQTEQEENNGGQAFGVDFFHFFRSL